NALQIRLAIRSARGKPSLCGRRWPDYLSCLSLSGRDQYDRSGDRREVSQWERRTDGPLTHLKPPAFKCQPVTVYPGLRQRIGPGIGVDPSTLARWERGEREPAGETAERVKSFPSGAKSASAQVHPRTLF